MAMLCRQVFGTLSFTGFRRFHGRPLRHTEFGTRNLVLPGPRFLSSSVDYRLYLVTDDKYVFTDLPQRIGAFIDGGVTCVQMRMKNAGTADYVEATRRVIEVARPRGVPVLVDDRLDVCLAAQADGLHVGAGDMDPAIARRLLGPDKLIGVSTYGEKERVLAACGPDVRADYVAGGGVATSSTKTYPTKGAVHLRGVKDLLTSLPNSPPLVAIGGIGCSNVFDVLLSGADGVACVASLLDGPAADDVQRAKELRSIVDDAHAAILRRHPLLGGETLWAAIQKLRAATPLTQCITNYVSMDIMANVLLASGASPAMVHAAQEIEQFVPLIGALSINIGTLSPSWVEGMYAAAKAANAAGKPWVLDPVAAGCTAYRTGVAADLLKLRPTVLRGNGAEVLALAGLEDIEGQKGVDSSVSALDAIGAAQGLARKHHCIVVVTGAVDIVTDGTSSVAISNGVPMLQQITASGCSLSSLIAAFCAVQAPLEAAIHGCAYFGLAAQVAQENGHGPGSLRAMFMDSLSSLGEAQVRALTRIEVVG